MTKINIRGVIVDDDTAAFYSWFDMQSASPTMVSDILNDADDDVEVDINSNGGDVFAASEIYTLLRAYSGKVTINITGMAASAASVIAMAGDEVVMSPTAQMMIITCGPTFQATQMIYALNRSISTRLTKAF